MNKYILLVLLFFSVSKAQVEFNGTVDFEVGMAGEDSRFISNEVANEFRRAHLTISQLNLFAFTPIGEDFSVNARLQWDIWGTGKLNTPRITLAVLNWEPEDSPLSIAIGRFVSPFGLYPRRQLAADNLFAQAPLAYGYFINISDTRGFWPGAGNSGIYGPDDVGLTTLYFGGYHTGGMISYTIVPDILHLDLVAANAAPASQADYTNLSNAAGIARIGVQPLIYWQQGFSFAYGSFMQQNAENGNYDRLERFKQMVVATDWVLAHSYFELSGEFIYSMWKVPGFQNGVFKETFDTELGEFDLENYSAYADFKIEPPFLTGSYVAFRYDMLRFREFNHPSTTAFILTNPWDTGVSRYAVSFGYKFDRSILFKLVFSDQKFEDVDPDPEDYNLRGILTVSF